MRRGIHLRQLRNQDLTILGVDAGRVPEPACPSGHVRLEEVDPVMGRIVREMQAELEELLLTLTAALAAVGREN